MIKKHFIFLSLIILCFAYAGTSSATDISSKVCSATTKVCISNVTNELTVKDEELLQACKDCCDASQFNTPNSIKGAFKGCTPRCKKSCGVAYKKAIAKANKGN